MAHSAFSQSNEYERQALPPEQRSSWISPWIALAAIVLVLFFTRGWWRGAGEPRGVRHPAVGREISRFDLQPLTGDAEELDAANLLGKVTLVNFWGPWCGACAVEFPHLVEIERHFRERDRFQFVSVSTNFDVTDESGLAESTTEFLKRHAADFPTYRDPRGQSTRAIVAELSLEDFGYPTTILIGPDKTALAVWPGYAPGDEKVVQQAIERALQQRLQAPKTPSAPE